MESTKRTRANQEIDRMSQRSMTNQDDSDSAFCKDAASDNIRTLDMTHQGLIDVDQLFSLPGDIKEELLEYLETKEILSMCLLDRSWWEYMKNSGIWRKLNQRWGFKLPNHLTHAQHRNSFLYLRYRITNLTSSIERSTEPIIQEKVKLMAYNDGDLAIVTHDRHAMVLKGDDFVPRFKKLLPFTPDKLFFKSKRLFLGPPDQHDCRILMMRSEDGEFMRAVDASEHMNISSLDYCTGLDLIVTCHFDEAAVWAGGTVVCRQAVRRIPGDVQEAAFLSHPGGTTHYWVLASRHCGRSLVLYQLDTEQHRITRRVGLFEETDRGLCTTCLYTMQTRGDGFSVLLACQDLHPEKRGPLRRLVLASGTLPLDTPGNLPSPRDGVWTGQSWLKSLRTPMTTNGDEDCPYIARYLQHGSQYHLVFMPHYQNYAPRSPGPVNANTPIELSVEVLSPSVFVQPPKELPSIGSLNISDTSRLEPSLLGFLHGVWTLGDTRWLDGLGENDRGAFLFYTTDEGNLCSYNWKESKLHQIIQDSG